jgi:hypothetical protein
VEFCVPVCKSNVKPNPTGSVPPAQQEIDHLCYKIACPRNTPTLPAAADQFGTFQLRFLKADLLCTPAIKVTGQPTTTTTTTSTTTTTTLVCQFSAAANACVGNCPSTAPAGSQCQLVAPGQCSCAPPPVCCQCPGAACFDTNGQCPPGCATFPGADCNASTTGQCGCGFCASSTGCTTVACAASQPCPQGTVCDPLHCPAPCSGPCTQGATCGGPCFKADGTAGQCQKPGAAPCACF